MRSPDKSEKTSEARILAEFLVGNNELEELSARLSEFDIFRVLRIERAEIRHSNVLGWLLNPRESHGLGDAFLRRFMSTLLLNNERVDFGLSPAEVELMNLVDVEVRREWRNIDLIIYSRENRFVLLVENKLRGKESRDQLRKYKDIVRTSFPGDDRLRIIPVLLTLEGDQPSEVARKLDYIPWSHAAIFTVAKEVVSQQQSRIPQDAQIFIHHYLATLRRETMQDKELEDLCKRIYGKHKTAIELIVKYGATTAFRETAEEFVRQNVDLMQLESTANDAWFIPKEWKRKMPTGKVANWRAPYPVSLWFVQYAQIQKIGIILEIGPVSDPQQRRKLVDAFSKGGFRANVKAYRETAKYTRVYSRFHVVNDLGDPTEIKQTTEDLWQQSKKKVDEATKIIRDFRWND